jgi:hypothetical protein
MSPPGALLSTSLYFTSLHVALLSREDFETAARRLAGAWPEQWRLCETSRGIYLRSAVRVLVGLRCSVEGACSESKAPQVTAADDDDDEALLLDEGGAVRADPSGSACGEAEDRCGKDTAALDAAPAVRGVELEHHIVLNPTFRVPQLLVWAYEGERALDLAEIAGIAPPYLSAGPEQPHLTAVEHPVLGVPCFALHACRTASVMECVLGKAAADPARYIVSWLSSFGPAAGLHVPLRLASLVTPNSE